MKTLFCIVNNFGGYLCGTYRSYILALPYSGLEHAIVWRICMSKSFQELATVDLSSFFFLLIGQLQPRTPPPPPPTSYSSQIYFFCFLICCYLLLCFLWSFSWRNAVWLYNIIMLESSSFITWSLSVLYYSCPFAGLKIVVCLGLLSNIEFKPCWTSLFFLCPSSYRVADCSECLYMILLYLAICLKFLLFYFLWFTCTHWK